MKLKLKICKTCKKERNLWKSGECKSCSFKSNPPKKIAKYSAKGLEKRKEDVEKTKRLHSWFNLLWSQEPHYSEISGKFLGSENSSMYWHHIFSKSQFPEYEFDRNNLIRISGDEHATVETNPYFYEEVNKRREILKQKYNK